MLVPVLTERYSQNIESHYQIVRVERSDLYQIENWTNSMYYIKLYKVPRCENHS